MPITEKNGKWYWGKKGPYNTKEAAERVATAAYLSGYKKKTGVMPKKKPYKGKFIRDGKIVRKEEWEDILQSGDNFKREKEEGLHGCFLVGVEKKRVEKHKEDGLIVLLVVKKEALNLVVEKMPLRVEREDADLHVGLVKHIKEGREHHEMGKYN